MASGIHAKWARVGRAYRIAGQESEISYPSRVTQDPGDARLADLLGRGVRGSAPGNTQLSPLWVQTILPGSPIWGFWVKKRSLADFYWTNVLGDYP